MAITRTETTQADWNAGTLSNVVATGNGDLVLANSLISDGSSLSGWTAVGATVNATNGNPAPSLQALGGQYAYKDVGLSPGCTIEFDVYVIPGTTALCNFYFLCDVNGTGQMFRLDARGTHYSGFASTTSWTNVNEPTSGFTVSAGTWYHVKLVIGQSTVEAFVNGVSEGTYTFANNGGYIGVHGDKSTVTGGYFDNIVISSRYALSGFRVSPPFDLSSVGIAASSSITWTATTPTNTAVAVDVSLDGGVTWQSATNGGAIPGITAGMNLSGKSLLVRQTLSTTDPTVTPTLSDLTVTVGALQTATATAQGGATESVSVAWIGYVRASAQADGSVAAMANFLAAASGMAIASSSAEWNEHILLASVTATAGATVDASAIRLLIQTLVVNAIIQPGDIVEIDTSRMTVKINGINALQFSEGDFFALLPGTNYLEYQDSETQRNVQIITRHRPRWL